MLISLPLTICPPHFSMHDVIMCSCRPTPGPGSPLAAESGEGVPTYQDPNTISHTPHPSTGEVYTDVSLDKKTKKKKTTEQVEAGPTYQVLLRYM